MSAKGCFQIKAFPWDKAHRTGYLDREGALQRWRRKAATYETREDAWNTFALAKELMLKGYAHHLQATVVMPYPGTPLFQLCQQHGWIRFDPREYERYDMTEPACVLTDMSQEEVVRMAGQFYKIYLDPRFLAHQLRNLRSLDDLDYMRRGVTAIWGHLKDFAGMRGH